MLYFFDLLERMRESGGWYLFVFFVAFVWLVMLPRMIMSLVYYSKEKRCRKYSSEQIHKCSVIVPTLKECPVAFRRCLDTLNTSLGFGASEYEIIVVVDGLTEDSENEEVRIARELGAIVITHNSHNKRKAIMLALRIAKHDIVLTSDSDTFYEKDTVLELLRPFGDSSVGGVTSAQRIDNPQALIQRIADWLENARIYSSLPSMSLFGQVGCLPGRAIAYRKQLLINYKNEFINEVYMGRECIVGDDRAVTNYILQQGYKTVFTPYAKVTTLAPGKFLTWTKQQLRWSRSSQRYTLMSPMLMLKNPVTAFIYYTDIMITIFTTVIVFQWAYNTIVGNIEYSLLYMATQAIIGMSITVVIRQMPHLSRNKMDWWLIPVFAILITYLQLIRFYGLMTLHKANVWGTRPSAIGSILKKQSEDVL